MFHGGMRATSHIANVTLSPRDINRIFGDLAQFYCLL